MSLHPLPDAAGTPGAAGTAGLGHLPQVDWQKLPASMKEALHLPNAFCRRHIFATNAEVCVSVAYECMAQGQKHRMGNCSDSTVRAAMQQRVEMQVCPSLTETGS